MTLPEAHGKRILYTCLDWGSGHVSRSIGFIRRLVEQENTVYLYCSEAQRFVFEQYALPVTYLVGEKFGFRFRGDGNFTREMLRNGFRFLRAVKQEQRLAEALVKQHNIELIVSDHCYGFRSNTITSVFVTHQVELPPKSGRMAQRMHRKWMQRFSAVWIMDNAEKRLAGVLSSPTEHSSYIGWFSRFENKEITTIPGKVVGIVSGPEPYAEQLFHWIIEQYGTDQLTIIAPKRYAKVAANVEVICDWREADAAILSAETVVSRNGYSTLMDLKFLNKKAVLIPTPGQLEQEYLKSLE